MKSYAAIVMTPGNLVERLIIQALDYTKAYLKITYGLPIKTIIIELKEIKR